MSGGELSKDQPEVACEFVNVSRVDLETVIRRIINRASMDPYGFVLNEDEPQ
jgi:hypothetical protein